MYFDQLLSAGHTRKVAENFFLVISTIFIKKIKNYPTIAGAFLNNAIIKDRIPKLLYISTSFWVLLPQKLVEIFIFGKKS